jgi:hypothetical protein
MDMHHRVGATSPELEPDPDARAAADEPIVEDDAISGGALSARYMLVEDLDHLWRTGQTRRVLTIRWVR